MRGLPSVNSSDARVSVTSSKASLNASALPALSSSQQTGYALRRQAAAAPEAGSSGSGSTSFLPELGLALSPRGAGIAASSNAIVAPSSAKGKLEQSRSELLKVSGGGSDDAALVQYRPLEVGLENLGNTCFMNAALQCLLHIQPLVSFFLRPAADIEAQINPDSPTKGILARSFAQMCRDLFSTTRSSYSPVAFQKAVASLAPQLLDYQQQDCQEFLRFLLDGLSEDLSRKAKGQGQEQQELEGAGKGAEADLLSSALGSLSLSSPSGAGAEAGADAGADASSDQDDQQQAQGQGQGQGTGRDGWPSGSGRPGARAVRRVVSVSRGDWPTDPSPPSLSPSPSLALSPTSPSQPQPQPQPQPQLSAAEQAERAWAAFLSKNNSVVSNTFAGLLQSTVQCLTCQHRSLSFDPFLDLSVEVPGAAGAAGVGVGRVGARRAGGGDQAVAKCSLQDCLSKFTAEETLEGYDCERCKAKRRCVKRLSIFRLPPVLVVHIKRFRFSGLSRDKVSTDVSFPLAALDLAQYVSPDRASPAAAPAAAAASGSDPAAGAGAGAGLYDLIGVSNHSGGLGGGHYIAHVDTSPSSSASASASASSSARGAASASASGSGSRWICFNDARASPASTAALGGPSAYLLFFKRRGAAATF